MAKLLAFPVIFLSSQIAMHRSKTKTFLLMTVNATNSPVIENVKKETAHMPSIQPVGSKLSQGA